MTDESTEPRLCGCCSNELAEDERATCRACVGKVRADLHVIVSLWATLPEVMETATLGSNAPRRNEARGNDTPMPGGIPLIFLSGGGDGAQAARRTMQARAAAVLRVAGGNHPWRSPTANEPDIDADWSPEDPASVAWTLGRIEDEWRDEMNMPGADHPYLVQPAAAFLHLHLQWAANKHPAFPDHAEQIRQLRTALEHATGTHEGPLTAEAPCIDCRGPLVRKYRAVTNRGTKDQQGGLEEDWTCRFCRSQYTPGRYGLAVADMSDTDEVAGPWTPIAQAATDVGRSYRTLQTWIRRGHLKHRTHPTTDLVEVRLFEARQVAKDRRPTEKAG